MLIDDLKKLKDYEKEKEWKSGARMLMHELKNPLTPLKLSAQNLLLGQGAKGQKADDIQSMHTAIRDIEYILHHFKELVNIEFGPKENIDLKAQLDSFHKEADKSGISFPQTMEFFSETPKALSEGNLLKMLYMNLVKNGIEANQSGFHVHISEQSKAIIVKFITPDRNAENPARLFKPGYSTKGKHRGFGLFLSKKISDYLDHYLECESGESGIIFSLTIKKPAVPD
jgi:two-component system nitrogen regulation sensor histidine kinase NtrY